MHNPICKNEDGSYPSRSWPGCYPLYYTVADMGILCPKCANDNAALDTVDPDFPNDPPDAQWHVVAQEANWEDPDLHCDHCYTRIPSAYAEDEVTS